MTAETPPSSQRVALRGLQVFAAEEASEAGEGGVLEVRSRTCERPTKVSGRLEAPECGARLTRAGLA